MKSRKRQMAESERGPEGPWEKAVREAAKEAGWKIRVLPAIPVENGVIRVSMEDDVRVEITIHRGEVMDDNHWRQLALRAHILGQRVEISRTYPKDTA